jgi:hypothetical protein
VNAAQNTRLLHALVRYSALESIELTDFALADSLEPSSRASPEIPVWPNRTVQPTITHTRTSIAPMTPLQSPAVAPDRGPYQQSWRDFALQYVA